MKAIIIYSTKYGSTGRCAELLGKTLGGGTVVHDISKAPVPDLSTFDTVIIGSPVYVGKIKKEVAAFCDTNSDALKEKAVGLFILGIMKNGLDELASAFPKGLVDNSKAKAAFGGQLDYDRMSLPDKLVTKMISKVDTSLPSLTKGMVHSTVSEALIKQFAASLSS